MKMVKCSECSKISDEYFLTNKGLPICLKCKQYNHGLEQFCVLCKKYIKTDITSTDGVMYFYRITKFSPEFPLGKPNKDLTVCEKCHEEVK
jgi:hypothetical protein